MFSSNLLHLLHLASPALPIGGFSHSAGLETYVQAGIVSDKDSAKEFVVQQLSQNIFYTDAALVSLAYDAAATDDTTTILQLDELCNAVKLPKEMRQASIKLGTRLLKIFAGQKFPPRREAMHCVSTTQDDFVLNNGSMMHRLSTIHDVSSLHHCVAFGLIAHALNIPKTDALTGFYYNSASGFVTNSVKLIPLGQQDGQQILMSLFPLIEELVTSSLTPDKAMIGYCCSSFDIRSMQHEQLYSRLYMS